ncbi:MAG TPA: glycosyltransferase family 4 protein [Chitinispirillaceae bacterium]|nr:glycosyltransferase family 4 protein [Chitinispirillaceae bacterium]
MITCKPNLTIAFITHVNTKDRTIFSGTPFYISRYLDTCCGNVVRIDNLIPDRISISYLLKNLFVNRSYLLLFETIRCRLLALTGKHADWRMSANAARYCARQIKLRLNETNCDLIWVEKSCVSLRYLDTNIPIIYESDATFQAMIGYYPWFSNLSENAVKTGNETERNALRKATAVIHTSRWAKESAVNDYCIEPQKIYVLPSPPNLDKQPDRDIVLKERLFTICNLLFVGVDWHRKGGDIALAVVDQLIHLGINAKLTICGCTPPGEVTAQRFVDVTGYLDKNSETDRDTLKQLFLEADFFILPTRAECMGISFSDAMAFGLPLIATDTGGVSTVVKHERNGLLFSCNETPETIAESVANIWNDKKRYSAMRCESRNYFEKQICVDVWAASVNKIIAEILGRRRV